MSSTHLVVLIHAKVCEMRCYCSNYKITATILLEFPDLNISKNTTRGWVTSRF